MDAIEQIKRFADSSPHAEACGVVIAQAGKKCVAVQCRNAHHNPAEEFAIDPVDYAIARKGGEVIAIWHSHLTGSASASPKDTAGCDASGIPWIIVAGDSVNVIQPCGEPTPYLGRPYVFGTYDCYSLARDYYRREFGIVMSDYERIPNFWDAGMSPIVENYEAEGFFQVKKLQRGDIVVIQTKGEPSHLAIYIGDDLILHHPLDRLSRRDTYAGYWAKHTVLKLRHKHVSTD